MPAVHRRFASLHRGTGWLGVAEAFGVGAAILLGDLCLSWADELLTRSGLAPDALLRGKPVYDLMRTELMAGQYLDLLEQARGGGSVERALRVVRYKSAKYTVERPLHLGAALAGGGPELLESLHRVRAAARRGVPAARRRARRLRRPRARPASRPATTCARASARCSSRSRWSRRPRPRPRGCVRAPRRPAPRRRQASTALREVIIETGALAAVEALIAGPDRRGAGRADGRSVAEPARVGARRARGRGDVAARLMRTVTGPTDHVVVVGAGLGGLSAALRLAGAGRQVTVLEREAVPGGRAGLLELGGYRFDTGPTVLTMPRPDRRRAGLRRRGARRLARPRCRFAPLPRVLPGRLRARRARRRRRDGRRGQRRLRPGRGRRLPALRRLRVASSTATRCATSSTATSTPRSACSRRRLARLAAIGGFRRLAPKVGQFLKDPRTQRVFSFQSMYAGLSPHDALAIYAVIAYMDSVAGVFFPRGGMHAVPRALAGAAEKHGVDIRYGIEVASVEIVGDARRGGHTRRRTHPLRRRRAQPRPAVANATCSAVEPRRLTYSPSCFLLLAGSPATYSQTAHHNIHFGRAWTALRRADRRGPPDVRPVVPRDEPDALGPLARARRPADLLRALPHAEPRRPTSTGRSRARATATRSSRRSSRAATSASATRSRSSRSRRRGLGRAGSSAARRSPRRTPSARPARSGRATSGARTWSSPAPAPCPGSASRWC